jgi:hypothetical protein
VGIQQGQFVEVRGRPWLVEAVNDSEPDLTTLRLSCIADDAQGEQIEVLWDAEIGTRVIADDTWAAIGRGAPDSPDVLAAYLRAIRWRTATAADRDLLQAPFRAGIRLDAYKLLPLRKALRLPRVNLLIADDVGLGKTVEAGLVARELLLRRRIDLIVISAPPAMIVQWKDELESKFGLTFDIIDRERVGELRRQDQALIPCTVSDQTKTGITTPDVLLRARPASLSCTRIPFLLFLLEPRSRRCRCVERASSGRMADKRRGLLSMRTAPSGGRRRSGPACSQLAQRTNAQSRGLFGRPATCSGSCACWVCALTVTLCFTRSAAASRLMASCHV